MLSYLPNAHELSGVAGLAATLLLFLALGSAATPRRTLPEFQFTAGWGVACLVLTAWGVLTPWSLRWPAAALGLAAVALAGAPRLARAPGRLGRVTADARAHRAVLAADALGLAVADRHLAQPAAECGLSVRPRPAADRVAADQLLLPAGRALQHPVRRLSCLACVRRLRRWRHGPVQRRPARRRGPVAGPRACRHGRGHAALVGLCRRAAAGGTAQPGLRAPLLHIALRRGAARGDRVVRRLAGGRVPR